VKYSVITFGCRVNQADSLGFEEQLVREGAQPAPAESADLVVVNSCSVTASADQGARQTIRRIARINPKARIVVTGCYATRDAAAVGELPNVERVVCNDDKATLVSLIRPARPDSPASRTLQTTAERFGAGDGNCGAAIEPGAAGRTAFTLRVQTGCSESCSYCIIPETRGRPRSLPLAQVLREARRVCDAGFREIALTGVHLGSYGRDLNSGGSMQNAERTMQTADCTAECGIDAPASRVSLLTLLRALRDQFEPLADDDGTRVLFRISSLEPMDCVPEIVDLVRGSSCFAPHFHLPLQHASPRMLQAMRRPYDLTYYAALVDEVRRRIPNASIGSDVIVGFPGESDADFEMLASYLERSPLTHLHVFPYSDRPGTAASSMGSRPAGIVVKERGARIRRIGAALTRAFVESQVGTVHRALTLEDGAIAVTGNYLKVRIPPGLTRNAWTTVRIVAAAPTLAGEFVANDDAPVSVELPAGSASSAR
jgi:threonylcarbamoyladenosine tRNA methylthiotransferase MtaB